MNKETREAIGKGKMVDFDVDEFMKDLRSDRVTELEAENAELRKDLLEVAKETVQRGVVLARMEAEVMAIRDTARNILKELLSYQTSEFASTPNFADIERIFANYGITEANND